MSAETPVIEIDTSALAKPIGRTAWVRIGGEVFEARCPKDAVLARISETSSGKRLSLVRDYVVGIFGREAGARIGEMLDNEDLPEVSLVTLMEIISYLLDDENGPQWATALTESIKGLGSGPRPRTVRTAPAKAPAKKAAAKKTTAARRR